MERIPPEDALRREGMTYRINVRTAYWVIVAAVVCGLVIWWAWTW
jgi:hypothetical protein